MEIEQAYRKLGVKPGASFKEVVEAREDLLAVWHPDRLSDKPRLRSKARAQVREINEAYEALMKHLGRTSTVGESSASANRTTEPTAAPSGDAGSDQPSASLFDEVFSEGTLKSRRQQIPIWPFFALIIVVGPLVSYLLQSSGGDEAEEPPSYSPATEVSRLPTGDEVGSDPEIEIQALDQAAREAAEPTAPTRDSSPSTVGQAPAATPAAARASPDPVLPARQTATQASSQPPEESTAGALTSPSTNVSPPDQPEREPGRPLLVRDPGQPQDSGTEEEESSSSENPETPSQEALRAYSSLLEKSAIAQRLVGGGFEALQFLEWKVVQERGSEIWIDLIVTGPDGGQVHFIWSVDAVDGVVRALSQAARNLESENRAQ